MKPPTRAIVRGGLQTGTGDRVVCSGMNQVVLLWSALHTPLWPPAR